MGVIMLGEIHNRENQGAIGQEPILSRLQLFPAKQGRTLQGRTFLSLISGFSVRAYAYAYVDDLPVTCEAPFFLK